MSEVKSWSTTAANNNSAPPDGWPENQSYASVNNCAREMMSAIVKWHDDLDGELVSGGSSGAYTLTPNVTYSAYEAGMALLFMANHANTGAATLNVSSLGVKSVVDEQGNALRAGDIVARQPVLVVYDTTGGNFRCLGLNTTATGTFTPVIEGTTIAGSGTYTAQIGRYSKTGRMVQFSIYIAWADHTGTGNMRISGLPFTVAAVTNNKPPCSFWASNLIFTGQLTGRLNNNATTLDPRSISSGAADSGVTMDTSGEIALAGVYEAA